MGAAVEIILAFLSAIGLLGLGWLLFGRLLTPAGGARGLAVIPGRGDGEELEQAVAGFVWLRGGELLRGDVVIADCGLTDAGRATAQALAFREPGVYFCPAERLEAFLEEDGRQGA